MSSTRLVFSNTAALLQQISAVDIAYSKGVSCKCSTLNCPLVPSNQSVSMAAARTFAYEVW